MKAQTRLETISVLGKGSQGVVLHAKDKLYDADVAVKYIQRDWCAKHQKYILRELLNHWQISAYRHPHIVEFHEVVRTPNYLGLIMEYVEGTNLYSYLKQKGGKLQEDEARFVFQQIIVAVDFCFRLGKVNRDLKPANILVKTPTANKMPNIKLCDFGFSKDKEQDSLAKTRLGTAHFVAPEILIAAGHQPYDARASDIWACGVILAYMLLGYHPFVGPGDPENVEGADPRKVQMQVMVNVVEGKLQLPSASGSLDFSSEGLELLRMMLNPDPTRRISAAQIMDHPWFLKNLPPGARAMNAIYLACPPGKPRQTAEDLETTLVDSIGFSENDELPEEA